MTPKEMLHTVLLDLNQRVEANDYIYYRGICFNLCWEMLSDENFTQRDLARDMLNDLMRDWPEGTGSHSYPVPGSPDDLSVESARVAMGSMHLWVASSWYGQQRRKLLAWLLEQTAEQTK